jgi:pimeloyl-ACP methyl ester carboxylesterase
MFRNLIPSLPDLYHVIPPDYPGYGQSDMPDRSKFAYTFDRFAELVDGLLDQLSVKRYTIYVMDYDAPVGWRLALKHPERVTGLIAQNGNAYEEGLKEFWDPIKAYGADHSEAHRKALNVLVAPETTKFQYTDGVADLSRISPDNWVHDQALLDRPGNADIQSRPRPRKGATDPGYWSILDPRGNALLLCDTSSIVAGRVSWRFEPWKSVAL